MRNDSRPSHPTVRAWLHADGSLTARLRMLGTVEVVVLRQSSQLLWKAEQDDLQCCTGHVREVALLVNGIPAVWARSAASHRAVQGPWKALSDLGSRPLAELLFQGRHILRDPLRSHHLLRHGLIECHLRNAWFGLSPGKPAIPLPRWARSSVFRHQGQPLRVMEAFAPWIVAMQVH